MTEADTEPRARIGTPVDGVEVIGSISPSRAADFRTCPLLYRLRTIDRLPEAPSPLALRGTVVHKVLEDLFDLPALERTPERAESMVQAAWEFVLDAEPEAAELFTGDGGGIVEWLAACQESVRAYFALEDPRRLEPAERELYVEALLDSRLLLRGFVDRVDVAPDGAVRVVDYKGLAIDTALPTPTGWTTMAEVEVGDLLMGTDGRPTQVLLKSEVHHRPCYRITFRDGSTVVCDSVHLWSVVESRRQVQTRHTIDSATLADMHQGLSESGRPRSLWVDAAEPLVLDDVADLPIDPWLLGAWLGDGDTRSGQLTVGAADLEDMVALLKEHWPRQIRVRQEGSAFILTPTRWDDRCTYGHAEFNLPTPGHPTRRCKREWAHAGLDAWNVTLSAELRGAGLLGKKHIPAPYLRAGTQQRIDLLRGLLDTDGWWNSTRRRAGFTTTDDGLARDVVELLRTLGLHPSHFRKPYVNAVRPGRTWHVIEFTPSDFNPFSLPRKAVALGDGPSVVQQRLSRRRVIASVVPIASVPTQCVAVDATDSLYLCGLGFVPTHNTGSSPGVGFEGKALFQMRFYGLVLWRTRGVVPRLLQLIYLGDGQVLSYEPDEDDLLATERLVEAVWQAIRLARETGEFLPRRGWACSWCSFQALCPEFGGTPPPMPTPEPVVMPPG